MKSPKNIESHYCVSREKEVKKGGNKVTANAEETLLYVIFAMIGGSSYLSGSSCTEPMMVT